MTDIKELNPTDVDLDKVELAKTRLKSKTRIWFSFLLFGWSYGSLGNLALQILWYLIPLLTANGIYQNLVTNEFTVFTSIALVFFPIWIIWGMIRMFTLNKAIDHYNRRCADYFGLNSKERQLLDIE